MNGEDMPKHAMLCCYAVMLLWGGGDEQSSTSQDTKLRMSGR